MAGFAYYCTLSIFLPLLYSGLKKKKSCFSQENEVIVANERGRRQEYHRAGVPFFHLLYMQEWIEFYATEISFPLVFMGLTNCLSLSLIKSALNTPNLKTLFNSEPTVQS